MSIAIQQIGSVPELLFMVLAALALLVAVVLLVLVCIVVVIRVLKLRVTREALSHLIDTAGDVHRLLLGAGFALTILFGVPCFLITFYDGSSDQDKATAFQILTWLLTGWGLGSGFSSIALLATRGRSGKVAPDPEVSGLGS